MVAAALTRLGDEVVQGHLANLASRAEQHPTVLLYGIHSTPQADGLATKLGSSGYCWGSLFGHEGNANTEVISTGRWQTVTFISLVTNSQIQEGSIQRADLEKLGGEQSFPWISDSTIVPSLPSAFERSLTSLHRKRLACHFIPEGRLSSLTWVGILWISNDFIMSPSIAGVIDNCSFAPLSAFTPSTPFYIELGLGWPV